MKRIFLFVSMALSVSQNFCADRPAIKEPPSLSNLGNSCYINSTIQVLLNIAPINNFLLFNARRNPYPTDSLAYLYVQLVNAINKMPKKGTPKYITAKNNLWNNQLTKFVNKVRKTMYQLAHERGDIADDISDCDEEDESCSWKLCGQHDAEEFLGVIINDLIEQNSRFSAAKSPVRDSLKIETAETITCPTVHFKQTRQKSPVTRLNLAASKHDLYGNIITITSLTNSLNHYFFEYTLDDYKPEGSATVQPDCKIKTDITNLSDIVIISFTRQAFNFETNTSVKLDHAITIPETLSFKAYMAPDTARGLYKYDLIGVIRHGGGTSGGHYWAYVKQGDQWYNCNDSSITATTFAAGKYDIDRGYVYVYQKNTKKPDR